MKLLFIVMLAAVITACAPRPPQVSTQITVKRTSPERVAVLLKVKNLENRPTTPIQIDVTAQMHAGAAWSKPESILHPAAFALNRNEEHTIPANLKSEADAIRLTLVVKEAETGNVLKTEQSQVAVAREPGG